MILSGNCCAKLLILSCVPFCCVLFLVNIFISIISFTEILMLKLPNSGSLPWLLVLVQEILWIHAWAFDAKLNIKDCLTLLIHVLHPFDSTLLWVAVFEDLLFRASLSFPDPTQNQVDTFRYAICEVHCIHLRR